MTGLPFYTARPQLARMLYIAALLAVILLSSVWNFRFASVTTDENLYDNVDGKVVIVDITEGGVSDRAGLNVGDEIVAINGNPVHDKMEANEYLVEGSGGETLEYTILRDGEEMTLRVVTATFGFPLFYIALSLTGLVFLLTGSYVFLRRPQYPVARLYGWAHLLAAWILFISKDVSFLHYPDALTATVTMVWPVMWGLMLSAFMHLFLFFPVPRFVKPLPQGHIILIWVLPLGVLFLLRLLTRLSPSIPVSGILLYIVVFITIAVIQIVITRNMKNAQSVAWQKRSRLPMIAIILGIVYIGGISIVQRFAIWQIVFFTGVAIPGLLFLTVIRQRLFDLYIVVRRGSLYTILSTALAVGVVLTFILLMYLLPSRSFDLPVVNITSERVEIIQLRALDAERQAEFGRRLYFLIGAGLIVALWWLYRRVRILLDQRFYRGTYDYKKALKTFSELSKTHSDRLALAENVIRDVVSLMHLKSAVFLGRSNGSFIPLADNRVRAGSETLTLTASDIAALAPALEKGSSFAADNLPLRERFKEQGVEFLTAVRTDGAIEALLLLGEKQSETNYTREDIELLDNLSINIADALTSMRFYESAREKERMRKELEIARRIQLASLPSEIPDLPGIDIAAHSLPAQEVGGDFYEFLPRHDATTFVLGDVSGKGTSAAMYLARIQGIIRTIESYQPSLWEMFVRLNTLIFDHVEKQSYVTMAALRVELLRNEVSYLRAGHLPLIHYNALSREISLHQPKGLGIGLDRHLFAESLEEQKIFVRAGDVFVLVSDGFTEAVNEDGVEFDMDRVTDCLLQHAGGNAQDILEALYSGMAAFTGTAERRDDATAVVIKFSLPHSSHSSP
ncbi:MAG: SpoIIE family protein phosphatase [Bacteroidetes bacterium]|nr:SpoIIE family protein phosphatase [Bacteroidota bacterium]